MNVQIFDRAGDELLVSWNQGEFNNYRHLHERIGGMISASFNVPCAYTDPYPWAKRRNQVEVYSDGGVLIFAGYISDLDRWWGDRGSGLKVDCVGWVAKLTRTYVTGNLRNEKGSTYLANAVLQGVFADYVSTWELDTDDYLIPGLIEVYPQKTKRWILDEIYKYNQDTHEWGVWGKEFYWRKVADSVSYYTTVYGGCTGSIRQGIEGQAKSVRCAHRNLAGEWAVVVATDTSSDDPTEYLLVTLDNNMSTAQATWVANAVLEEAKTAGTNSTIKVTRLWGPTGEMDIAEAQPGLILSVNGMVPGEASIQEADIDNDLDTFVIASIKYDGERGSADIGPGRLPLDLPSVIGGRA